MKNFEEINRTSMDIGAKKKINFKWLLLSIILSIASINTAWAYDSFELRGDHPGWSATAWTFSDNSTTTLYMAQNDQFKIYATSWGSDNWLGCGDTDGSTTLKAGDSGIHMEKGKKNVKYNGPSGMVCFHMDQHSYGNANDYPWVWITRPTWYLKHNWNDGSWSWYTLTDNEDGTYKVNGQYSGSTTVNYGDNGSDAGSGWGSITASTSGSPKKGDMCRFVFDASNTSCTITKLMKITYDGNGNEGGTKPDDEYIMPSTATATYTNTGSMTKTNYAFVGWNERADGTGTHYDAGANITLTADKTLYAEWKPCWVLRGGDTNGTSDATQDAMGNWGTPIEFEIIGENAFMLELNLSANTTYYFKICDRHNATYSDYSTYTHYGNNGTISNTVTDWLFETDKNNCQLNTGASGAGTWRFAWNANSKRLCVYKPADAPKSSFVSGKYLYLDARTNSNWKADNTKAKFWFKNLATGEDDGNVVCNYSNRLEGGVYYAVVPADKTLGAVQMNSRKQSDDEIIYTANVAYARERTSANQNCMVTPSSGESGITLTWGTYCPPMSSATLSDNSTTRISWQDEGNDGSTSGKAIWVSTSNTINVSATATSAVDDANMTKKFDFKVNNSSAQNTATATYSKSSLSNNTTYKISVDAYNNYNSTDGTKRTPDTLYYKALTTYTVTHTLSNVTCSAGRTSTDAAAYYQPYTATFAASKGYNLPATITVKFGETTKTAGTDYTWTQATGVLSIPENKIDGAVTVIVSGVAKTYTVNLNANGGTAGSVTSVTATYNAYPADHVFSDLLEDGALPTKSNYYLDGWYTETGGTGEKLIDGPTAYLAYGTGYLDAYTDASGNWIYDGNTTLYARWKANTSDDQYTFTYGSGTRYDASTWTVVALDTATNHMWQKTGFTMPDPTSKKFYVGFEEDFYRGHYLGWASPTKAQSAEVDLTSLRLAPGTQAIGTATGATGTLVLWSNSASDNLYVGFQPSGYGITYNSGTVAFAETDAANTLWETAPVTLEAADVSGNFQVKLATSSSYTTCALGTIETKTALDGRNGERPDLAAGQRGKFRMWANSSTNNFGLDFMPVYSVSFNMKGHGSAIDPYPSIDHGALIGAPPAPSQTGYTFGGWYKEAGCTNAWNFATDVVTENTTLYAKWTPETLTWKGGSGWNSTNSWDPACVPTIEHDVIIDKSCRVQVADAQAKSVTIHTGYNSKTGFLTIDASGALLVAEDVKVVRSEGGARGATTRSELWIETGYSGNGGLICGNASANTEAWYIFYSKVYRFGSYYINQYVGIPFAKMDPFDWYGVNVFEYNPEKDDWMTPSNDSLKSFTCYNIISKYSGGYTTFYTTGTLNLPGTDSTTILPCGSRYSPYSKFDDRTGENTNGDYMFANSWTAPISVQHLEASDVDGLLQEVHIFNAGFVSKDDSAKIVGDLAGQWTCISFGASAYTADSVIPATQAFCVTATKANAKLKLNYKKHVYDPAKNAMANGGHISTYPTRAPRRVKAAGEPSVLRIKVMTDSTLRDNMYVFEREDFTFEYDNGWDGSKIFGLSTAPQIWGNQGKVGQTSIQAVPNIEGSEIGFKAGTDTSAYVLTFEYNDDEPLYLYDKETNALTQITNEATYEFTTSDTEEHDRFLLTRSNAPQIATGVEEIDTENVQRAQKFMHNQQIFIRRGDKIYSIDGALVK